MQNVICQVKNCGYCSRSGFCLNRLVVINKQGVCNWLTKPGWERPIEEKYKSNAGVRLNPAESSNEEGQDLDKIQEGPAPA